MAFQCVDDIIDLFQKLLEEKQDLAMSNPFKISEINYRINLLHDPM